MKNSFGTKICLKAGEKVEKIAESYATFPCLFRYYEPVIPEVLQKKDIK